MILWRFQHSYTRFKRREVGMGDTEPDGSEEDEAITSVIAPTQLLAEAYVKSLHANDKAFKIKNVFEIAVHAIIGVDNGLGFRTRG